MQLQYTKISHALRGRRHGYSRQCSQCSCRAAQRPTAVATTRFDHRDEQQSKFAAALSAVLIFGAIYSPVAVAEESKLAAQVAGAVENFKSPQKQKLSAADEAFQNSGTLKALLEKSEANKAKNKRDIQNKYCYRQAELGIGDCGGLRYIPGMTKSGKQPTPEWLQKVLGVEVPKMEGQGKTLEQLLGPNPDQQ